jgi:hypothetical protein
LTIFPLNSPLTATDVRSFVTLSQVLEEVGEYLILVWRYILILIFFDRHERIYWCNPASHIEGEHFSVGQYISH